MSLRNEGTANEMAKKTIATPNPARYSAAWSVTKPAIAQTTAMPTAMRAAREVLSMRLPTRASSAGTSVIAARIIIATPIAEAMATPVTKLEADQGQAHQRDDDGDAGEQDGTPARVHRLGDGVLHARARA